MNKEKLGMSAFFLIWGLWFLLYLGGIGVAIYVVAHFLKKFW